MGGEGSKGGVSGFGWIRAWGSRFRICGWPQLKRFEVQVSGSWIGVYHLIRKHCKAVPVEDQRSERGKACVLGF